MAKRAVQRYESITICTLPPSNAEYDNCSSGGNVTSPSLVTLQNFCNMKNRGMRTCENWIHPLSIPSRPILAPISPTVTPGIKLCAESRNGTTNVLTP